MCTLCRVTVVFTCVDRLPFNRQLYNHQVRNRQRFDRQMHDRQFSDRHRYDCYRFIRQNYDKPVIPNSSKNPKANVLY